MKKSFCVLAALVMSAASVFAQGITTANEFFKAVSEKYATFRDYQANLDIIMDKKEMAATVLYMAPDKIRMDFSEPAEQTIVYDGK